MSWPRAHCAWVHARWYLCHRYGSGKHEASRATDFLRIYHLAVRHVLRMHHRSTLHTWPSYQAEGAGSMHRTRKLSFRRIPGCCCARAPPIGTIGGAPRCGIGPVRAATHQSEKNLEIGVFSRILPAYGTCLWASADCLRFAGAVGCSGVVRRCGHQAAGC